MAKNIPKKGRKLKGPEAVTFFCVWCTGGQWGSVVKTGERGGWGQTTERLKGQSKVYVLF